MEERSRLCSVWLGSETGISKGVSLDRKQAFNFCNSRTSSRQQEVRVSCWGDPAESESSSGCADGTVRTFSTEKGVFTEARSCGEPQEGCFSGSASSRGSAIVTCSDCGKSRVWREDSGRPVAESDAGSSVCRMRQSPSEPNRVATGGKENGSKSWDSERPDKPSFSAKNSRDDWSDSRRPHWVRDVGFIPDSDKSVTCTGYHQVHVFDPSTPRRRPVSEAEFGEYPSTASASPVSGGAVVVGNTQGQSAVSDSRKGSVRGCSKGATGSVRASQCHASQPVVASCGSDRHLRIHGSDDRTVQHKVYSKSRLNCLSSASRESQGGGAGGGAEEQEVKEEEEEEDEVWARMERVEEEEGGRKRKPSGGGEEEVKKRRRKKGGD